MEAAEEAAQREERSRLAQRLRDSGPEIERDWHRRLLDEARHTDREPSPLARGTALTHYLQGLVRALESDDGVTAGAATAWTEVAHDHCITQVTNAFDIEQLLDELRLLRQVISSIGVPGTRSQESLLIDLIQAAMALAVRSYVRARDRAARHQQAEHGSFVTHELRNPLTTALVTVSSLQRNADRPPGPERLQLLQRSLLRLRGLIDGVLAPSDARPEAVEVTRENVRLGDLVEEAVAPSRAAARDRGLELGVRIDPELVVNVDRQLSVSALHNLLENSINFCDEGRVELRAESQPDQVTLHIHDNCCGLSTEDLAIIFEPFRSGHSTKPNPGFGLAVARRAIVAQGGQIGAESSANHGCHFWLTLRKAHN